MKPYTGIEGNKIIGDLVQDVNDILIDLIDKGWVVHVDYVPKRWGSDINPVKSDSISIVIKKKQNRSGSKYPSNGALFSIRDIKEWTERIGDMFSDNEITVSKCFPGKKWNDASIGEWTPHFKNYYNQLLNNDDVVFGVNIIVYLRGDNIDQNEKLIYKRMKYLKAYEGFVIPKPIRKILPWWKDEDIALQVLKDLKSIQGNSSAISKLSISNVGKGISFTMDGFDFYVQYGSSFGPGGVSYNGYLKMNSDYLEVSTEVCYQIQSILIKLRDTDIDEHKEYSKRDFRLSKGLLKTKKI